MKRVVTFLLGFASCFVLMAGIGLSLLSSYAGTQKYEFEKASYPIYVNGVKTNVGAYKYQGNTYLKMNDLKASLKNLCVVDNTDEGVYLADKTGFGIMQYKGKKYVDLSCFRDRYFSGNLPHEYDLKFAQIYKTDKHGVMTEEIRLKINRDIDERVRKLGMEAYPNMNFYDYDDTKLKLVELLKICYENEKYIKGKKNK